MEYEISDKKIATYWRWGAYYLITFEDGSSAFVTIDKSEGGREWCTVWIEYDKEGKCLYNDTANGKRVSFIMSDDEARKGV